MTIGGLLPPAAFVPDARELLVQLGDRDMAAFRLRFGAGTLDLALEDRLGERTVRAVATWMALERAVQETIPVHGLDLDLADARSPGLRAKRCRHVQNGEAGTLDLLHGTGYCDQCVEDYTGQFSPNMIPAGLLPEEMRPIGAEPDDLMQVEDHWCHVCVAESEVLSDLRVGLPSGMELVGHFCPSCAGFIEELSDA